MARILVVEDSPTQAEAAKLMLAGAGHAPEVASTAEEALRRLHQEPFDLVLSDVLMPGMSGYELCQRIRSTPSLRNLPVILLTVLNQPSDIIRGLEYGADSYIIKPLEVETLLSRLRTVMTNNRLRHAALSQQPIECVALGERFTLTVDPHRTLEYLISTFEDFITSREGQARSQEALEQANSRYRALFENAADAIFVADDDSCCVDLNRQAEILTGFPREKLLGMRVIDLDAEGTVTDRYRELVLTGEMAGETRFRRSTGEVIPVELSARRMEPGRYQAIVRDISQRKLAEETRLQLQAEEALRTIVEGTATSVGEDFFRSLVQHLTSALRVEVAFACRVEGDTVHLLGSSATGPREWPLSGSIVADVLSRRVTWYPDSESRFPADAMLATHAATGFLGVPLTGSGGQRLGVLAVLSPAVQAEPRTISTLQVFAARAAVEIERVNAEAAMRASEAQYRHIIETTDQGVLELDRDGHIIYANRQAAALLGTSASELVGRPWQDFVADEDRDLYGKALKQREQRDVRFRRADQRDLWTILTTNPSFDDNGHYVGALAMMTDITERRTLEEQLRQAQKMEAIGQLAGGIAHDFNNLLTAITGYGEMVRASLPQDDVRREDMEAILRAGDAAARLVRQLLVFSRKEVVKPQVLSLNQVVVDTHSILSRLIGEHINLDTRLDTHLGLIHADRGRMQQIIMNLVVNARDAMPNGGRIVIQTSNEELTEDHARWKIDAAPGPYVLLSVADTGCGMTPEIMSRIFDPFFTTKEAGKGTGLGLPTVYGIVRDAGGHISVYSEPGLGTTFRVYLPRCQDTLLPVASEAPAAPTACTETILVVEDESMVRDLTVRILSRAGYKVLHASNGTEAVQKLQSYPESVDLVMTDVVLPEMNGPQLAALVRERRPGIKTLYMSGYSPQLIVRPGLLPDIKVLLEKPFTSHSLLEKVRLALQEDA